MCQESQGGPRRQGEGSGEFCRVSKQKGRCTPLHFAVTWPRRRPHCEQEAAPHSAGGQEEPGSHQQLS